MKSGVKRIIALLIFVCIINISFGGCVIEDVKGIGKGETDAAYAATETKEPETRIDNYTPKEDRTYDISYVTMTAGPVSEDSVVAKKYDEMFNVRLKPIYIESSKWDELFNMKLASGDIPDVFPSKSPYDLMMYVNQGLIQDMPMDLLKEYAPKVVGVVDRDSPESWNLCNINGKNYGFPLIVGNYVFRDPIVWRSDWLENVGIGKLPDTIGEWEEAFEKFRNDDPDKNGKKDTYGCSLSILGPVFGAFGVMVDMWWNGFWLEKGGKVIYSGIEPGAREALLLLNRWYEHGLIDPEFVTGENKGGYWAISTDFINGRIGVSALGNPSHWQKKGNGLISGPNQTELKKVNPKADFEYGNPPLGFDGRTRGTTRYPLCTGTTYVFSRNVEPDKLGRILQMFNWPLENHSNFLFNWLGIEGQHYKVTKANGYRTYESLEPYKSDRTRFFSEVGGSSLFWEYDVENAHAVQRAFFDNFTKMGFDKYGVVDLFPTLYMPSYSKVGTDLNKMLIETYVSIITGSKPIGYFDEFVKKWRNNGGDQLLKEANAYYQMGKTRQ